MTLLRTADGGVAVSEDGTLAGATDIQAVAALEAFEARHEDASGDQVSTMAVGKCSTAAPYSLIAKWAGADYGWFYNSSGQVNTTALSHFQTASSTIGNGTSTACGNLQNGLRTVYAGAISQRPEVTETGCGAYKQNSIIGWTSLAGDTLARTCSFYNPATNTLYVADIAFDTSSRSWYTSSSTTACTGNSFDLRGVAVHEFGHAVGLGHVADDEPQVMNPFAYPCDTSFRQLGRGDQNGLRAHYGS